MTDDALENVRRELRVAAAWKRDARIPAGVAAALYDYLAPMPDTIEHMGARDVEAVLLLATWLRSSERFERDAGGTVLADAVKRLSRIADQVKLDQERNKRDEP